MRGMGEDVEDFWDEYCYSLCNPAQSATSGGWNRLCLLTDRPEG